ncbi:MAG: DNA recombination protein RmuC [Kordiimonadaceae bacterium]|nr:DNA recombination protein RmuC [Kordiimonadaceae bacterium]
MPFTEILLVAGLLITIGLCVALMRQLAGLKAEAKSADAQNLMVAVHSRVGDMADQADRRDTVRRQELSEQLRENREEMAKSISSLAETVRRLGAEQAEGQTLFREKLDQKMKELRQENSQKLDEMRKTVDEKLQTTLERRISESFKTVSERLEAVQRGLGEMQNLAVGVGDLKRVLTNVKSRGVFGEVQLQLLIEDFLTAEQYKANYDCGKKSGTMRVEFGIRMPGSEECYMPVDAKFPTEDYERLLTAVEAGDKEGIDTASKALVRRVKLFAKDISQKYINPPFTTREAILFVPTEGLYAEVLRSPGLIETLQRDYSVTVTGPTNFQVLLSTFRMGYQQAVMQEHASEVWKVLGAVKKEFNNYGEQIAAMGKNVQAMDKHIDKLETRKNVMLRALKNVEVIENDKADALAEDLSE